MQFSTGFFLYLYVSLLFFSFTEAKLLVITHAYKRPDFIELQDKTFRAFLKDDYEFVVFNDAREEPIYQEIESTCKRLGITHVQIPQEIHSRPYLSRIPGESFDHPCVRCANVVQYSLDTLGFDHNGLVMIIDSDMFLLQNFSVSDYMEGYDIAGAPQSRDKVIYLWNGIVFFNMTTLQDKREINFNCGRVEDQPCDVGGYTHYYIKNHPELRLRYVSDHSFVGYQMDTDIALLHPFMQLMVKDGVGNSEFFLNHTLFHYRGGGNWDNKSNQYHEEKTQSLHKLIDFAIESKEFHPLF